MKKLKQLFIVFLSLAVVFSPVAGMSEDMGQFMKNVLDQMGNLAPRAYKGQERGYFIGGQMSVRVPQETIQPFSFTPPSYHAGCSGIDLTMGGFSYLNFDAIVQKLQAILQSAPFLAFDIAVGTLCQPCKAAMNAAESFSDFINQLNINSCAAAQTLVDNTLGTTVKKALNAEAAKDVEGGHSKGFFKSITDALNHASSKLQEWAKDINVKINGRDDIVTQASNLNQQISLIDKALEIANYRPFDGFEDFLRCTIGDITCFPVPDSTGKTAVSCAYISPIVAGTLTAGKDHHIRFIEDIVESGKVPEEEPNGRVTTATYNPPILNQVNDLLRNGLDHVKDNHFSDQQIAVFNLSPIPIIPYLKLCYMSNDPDFTNVTISSLAKPVAYGIFWATMERVREAVAQAIRYYIVPLEKTKPKFYADTLKKGKNELMQNLARLVDAAKDEYNAQVKDFARVYGNFFEDYKRKQAEVVRALQQTGFYNSYIYDKYFSALEEGK